MRGLLTRRCDALFGAFLVLVEPELPFVVQLWRTIDWALDPSPGAQFLLAHQVTLQLRTLCVNVLYVVY